MITNKKIDKRTLEVEASQGKRAKLKTISATIFHVLQDSPVQARKVWKALRKLHKVVKSNALTNGEGIYADYLFGGDNINLGQLDNQVKVHNHLEEKKYKTSLEQYEKNISLLHEGNPFVRNDTIKLLQKNIYKPEKVSHAIALKDPVFMQKLLDHGVNFDANLPAQKRTREFVKTLCPNGINFVDENSKNNIIKTVAMSESLGKKLIFIANHVSHMDAVVIDAFFRQLRDQKIIPSQRKTRFIEGVYMALTPGVRQFSIAFNTTKVIGESDMDMLIKHAKKNNNEIYIEYENGDGMKSITTTPLKQLKEMKRQIHEAYFGNKDKENGVIFQYAGRGENGGIKNSINDFMGQFLLSDECIFVSLNIHDTDKLKPTKSDFFIGAHTRFDIFDITVHASEPWIGGEKSLDDIHKLSIQQRDIMRPQFKDIEKKISYDTMILHMQQEISDILEYADYIGELNDQEIAEYNDLVNKYADSVQNNPFEK